ncbi:MBL fold metallo-hydrolase [Kocuria palustris]|uniref:MBL fold metallo-hydrolase n=1 Tax=Kocuria palustris TaxID=71999 RepID=UPI002301FDEC|nr:MBL fold metallo-hydrolase [Kocuria palustris]
MSTAPQTVAASADGSVRVERVVTSGTFSLDGGTWEVENNVWIVGDVQRCLVIDPAHSPEAVREAVAGREVVAVVLTHGHDDHVGVAPQVAQMLGAQTWLHPEDRVLWDQTHPQTAPDHEIAEGTQFQIGSLSLRALHTPGHAPGSVCLYAPELGVVDDQGSPVEPLSGVVFSGDTLFQGGPGATGRSYSDFPTIVESIRERLLTLPDSTAVLTGHGDSTTIGAEAPHVQEWLDRGH